MYYLYHKYGGCSLAKKEFPAVKNCVSEKTYRSMSFNNNNKFLNTLPRWWLPDNWYHNYIILSTIIWLLLTRMNKRRAVPTITKNDK